MFSFSLYFKRFIQLIITKIKISNESLFAIKIQTVSSNIEQNATTQFNNYFFSIF